MGHIRGARRQAWGVEIYVKVGGKQFQKTLPPETADRDIKKAREEFKAEKVLEAKNHTPAAVRGTLAADAKRFLEKQTGRRKIDFEIHLKAWVDEFGGQSRASLSERDVKAKFLDWQQTYSASTLNHRRQALISLFKYLDGPDHRCPARKVSKFAEPKGRKGFFEHHEYVAIREQIVAMGKPDYADLLDFIYYSGWRHAEARELTWAEVDVNAMVVRLDADRSKTDESRVLPLEGPLKEVIERRLALKRDDMPVFHYAYGGKRRGERKHRPIKNWRKTWSAACKAAKLEGKLIHDCRRTVVRNLTRAGVPQKVAMDWTGHKTVSIFNRYNIVNENDLRDAGRKMQEHIERTAANGTNSSEVQR